MSSPLTKFKHKIAKIIEKEAISNDYKWCSLNSFDSAIISINYIYMYIYLDCDNSLIKLLYYSIPIFPIFISINSYTDIQILFVSLTFSKHFTFS